VTADNIEEHPFWQEKKFQQMFLSLCETPLLTDLAVGFQERPSPEGERVSNKPINYNELPGDQRSRTPLLRHDQYGEESQLWDVKYSLHK
jgi:hypothetical protein